MLQASTYDDKVLAQRVLELVRSHGPQTVLSLSEHLGVSITLAGELVQVCHMYLVNQHHLGCVSSFDIRHW